MKRKLIRLITNKHNGASELITSMVAIAALVVFALFFIGVTGDVHSRIAIDQVARKYILRMEASGDLTSAEKTELTNDLLRINSVKQAVDAGGTINIAVNKGEGVKAYGKTITLVLDVPVITTAYVGITPQNPEAANEHPLANPGYTSAEADATMYGKITRNTITNFHVTKQSTAKY